MQQDGHGAAAPLSAAPARAIVVTGHVGAGTVVQAFSPYTPYALRLVVGAPTAASLAHGPTAIDVVPEEGLAARWIVWSENVELLDVRTEDDEAPHACRLASCFGGEAAGELRAVVDQDLADLDRRSQL